jgi:cobalt-zinc-cadmium efflux system outer membrane protein
MMTNLGFMWSQPLPWPGKRELRSEMAGREAALGERQLDRARLGLVAAIRRAYYGLLLARETLGLLQEQEATAREIEGVARARYAVGQGAQQDVLRAQIEVARIEQLRAEQQAEEAIRLAEINRLAARPAASALETSARLELVSETRVLESFQADAEAASPELGAALLEQERDGLAVELADKDGRPDFVVEAGYMNRGGLDPMWQAGVGVRLPLWRGRLQARRGEVALQREASERLGQAVRLQLRFRNQERLAQLSATERVARLYQEGIVPQAQMSVEAALASYKSGRVPFVTVLEALSTYYGDRAGLLRLLARHAQLRASLEELSLDSAPVLSAPAAAGGGTNAAGPSAGMPTGMQ